MLQMSTVMGLRDGLGKWQLNIHSHRSCAGRSAGPTDDEDGKERSLPLKEFSQEDTGCGRDD